MRTLAMLVACALAAGSAEKRVVFPPNAKPVGPYSPGILAGDFLYVSGQGARGADGQIPAAPEAQARQCLENIKGIVEAAGLTMEHVVYTQVYLKNMGDYEVLNRVWAEYFPKSPPARAVLGVYRMPIDTPVEVNAVAIRDLSAKKPAGEGGVLAGGRLYLSGSLGGDASADPAAQVQRALDRMGRTLKAAGLDFRHVVFVNPYLTDRMPMDVMNRVYAKHFEFGNTPARATIRVSSLPEGAAIEFTGVAVADLAQRRAVRPKNMEPSATASPCVWAGDTFYCSAKSGFIPGPKSGIYASTVEHQLRQTMRNLLDGLEEAGLNFSHVVATNVYVDNIDDFARMNRVYGQYFSGAPPTRTTVAQIAPVERKPSGEDERWPGLEQVSVVAVK